MVRVSSRRAPIGALQYVNHVISRPGLPQETHEPFVFQVPRNILQSSQVVARLILGRDQQEKDIDRLTVSCREIDATA
jgi:hypothetical protein